ncbi:hypothetical protein E2C01_082002 [Portunus trituberculatus]|uniref:Secreted protein n=1 Tax=Portunus trituberculatus TaxID=210409 RepID=A0A5B7IR84_PORTR|nr:hypothetical protein [Portunus trituberculatus]
MVRVKLSSRVLLNCILVRRASWTEVPTGPSGEHLNSWGGRSVTTGSSMEPDRCVGKVTWLWRLNSASGESKDRCIPRGFKSPRIITLSHR